MVMVDSSIWIEAARRQGDLATKVALRALLDEHEAAWCSPVWLGVLGGSRMAERRPLETFFACIPYVPCVESDWDAAKALAWRARGMRLYGRDAHFATLAELGGARLYSSGYTGVYQVDSSD